MCSNFFFDWGLGLSFDPYGILWDCKYYAWWSSWAVAVIEIPCNSDFGTSNKMGTNWGGRVVGSSYFWAGNGRHAVFPGSKKLLVRRQWVVVTKTVGVWYLCRLASKNLSDLRVPPRSSWELRSSGLLLPEERISRLLQGGTLKSRKFLQTRRHKSHTLVFLVCTTHWLLLIIFIPRTYRMVSIPRPKTELTTTRRPQLVPILFIATEYCVCRGVQMF